MTKDEFIGKYLEKKLKNCDLPYGIHYIYLRDKHWDDAEIKWKNKLKKAKK